MDRDCCSCCCCCSFFTVLTTGAFMATLLAGVFIRRTGRQFSPVGRFEHITPNQQ